MKKILCVLKFYFILFRINTNLDFSVFNTHNNGLKFSLTYVDQQACPTMFILNILLKITKIKAYSRSDYKYQHRAVGRSENPGVPVLFDGHNLPHLVEIGLTDLPKSNPQGRRPCYKLSKERIISTLLKLFCMYFILN